jgi:hypothetical protein
MPSHIFKIEDGRFGLTLVEPTAGTACEADAADYDAFTCQITSGALTAAPNVTQETVPATWCEPERQIPQVGTTSYSLEISYLQDPDLVDGLARFLFEHDTELAYFFMGLAGDDPPKAIGQVRLVSGAIGGEGRVTLTATSTLPLEAKPQICFGDADTSESVGGVGDATGATAGIPGTWTPSSSTPPVDQAELLASDITASPSTAWTTGQYVQTQESGVDGRGYWNGSAWTAGVAP